MSWPGNCFIRLRTISENLRRDRPTMKYPSTITLFMEPLPPSRQPSAFVVSAVTHGVLMTAACLGVFRVPTIKVRYPNERFTLRILKLENIEAQKRRETAGS